MVGGALGERDPPQRRPGVADALGEQLVERRRVQVVEPAVQAHLIGHGLLKSDEHPLAARLHDLQRGVCVVEAHGSGTSTRSAIRSSSAAARAPNRIRWSQASVSEIR